MGHLGEGRAVEKVQDTLVRKVFVSVAEACTIYLLEKSDHALHEGELQSSKIPEIEWQKVSLDFATGSSRKQQGDTGFLAAIEKVTQMVHPIQC